MQISKLLAGTSKLGGSNKQTAACASQHFNRLLSAGLSLSRLNLWMASTSPPGRQSAIVEIRSCAPRLALSSIYSSSTHRVTFHHPAYDSTHLFEVPAFDNPGGGIHHGTALLLCSIIADSVWDGWLTETRNGQKLDLDAESLLTGRDYFFHVPRPIQEDLDIEDSQLPYKYPVVPSFQHWRFPHDNPPPGWTFVPDFSDIIPPLFPVPSLSSVSQAVRDRDVGCRLSGYQDGIERAHLCPRSELEWFTKQEMDRYNTNQSLSGANLVDDMANALALRSDIHTAFDAGTFVFTRKQNSWVSHFLAPTCNIGPEYHNVVVEMPVAVHPVFILTHFAWAILPRIRNFLIRGEKRVVKLRLSSGPEDIKELTGEKLRGILGTSARGRSNSPQKRQREEDKPGDTAGTVGAISKRPCLNLDSAEPPKRSHVYAEISPSAIPDLCDVETNSSNSQPQPSKPDNFNGNDGIGEQSRIANLRHRALIVQRRIHSDLICCDYNAADNANRAGVEGPKEFGGAHLCMQCLGAEFRNDEAWNFSVG